MDLNAIESESRAHSDSFDGSKGHRVNQGLIRTALMESKGQSSPNQGLIRTALMDLKVNRVRIKGSFGQL